MALSKRPILLLAAASLAVFGCQIQAAVLISDNFDTVATSADINGRAPVVNTINGNAWSATTSSILGSGSGTLIGNPATLSHSASIDLGADYLTDNPGLYSLSSQFSFPSGSSALGWVGMGFTPSASTAQNFVGNNGSPWLLYRANGTVIFFGGPNTLDGTTLGTLATGSAHNFELELDTSGSQWLANVYIDGVQYDLNGSAAGMSFALGSAANFSHYIGLATGVNGTTTVSGTIDNFVFEAVPEPRVTLLLGLSFGMLFMRRRRL